MELAIPAELGLGDLLPAIGAFPGPVTDDGGHAQAGEVAAGYDGGGHSRAPLLGGLIVTLLMLFCGGGFLWWRNRDSRYFPA